MTDFVTTDFTPANLIKFRQMLDQESTDFRQDRGKVRSKDPEHVRALNHAESVLNEAMRRDIRDANGVYY